MYARAHPPTHTHTHAHTLLQCTRLRPPHRNCRLYRGNRSPQSPAISPAATSLLTLPPSSPYILLDQRHLHRATLKLHHDRYRYLYLPASQSVDAYSLMGGMQDSSPILRERVNAANYRQTENRVFLRRNIPRRNPFALPFSVDIFLIFPSPPSLSPSGFRFVTPQEETRDDEVRDRGETVKSISTEGMSGEEGRVGGGFGSRGIGFPRGDPFSRRGSFARLKWSEIGRRQSDWEDFWKKTRLGVHFLAHTRLVTGGTNFPGLRTGREARLRGRNSMEEDFEECSSFKGWG